MANTYVFGKDPSYVCPASHILMHMQPLLHAIIFAIEITMITVLVRKFNAYYQNRPVLTTMITNAVRPLAVPSASAI